MADVNANIGVNIDTSDALSQLKSLQRQISQFHTSIARSSETAALAQRDLQRNLVNSINSIQGFSAEMRTIKTSAESFTDSLEKNKFSMREYFRYAGASTKTFGKLFTSEFDTISKVAEERVKKLQTQYIKLGRDSSGAMKAIAVIPTELNMNDFATKTQIAAQKQAIFNQLIKQGSTQLLNFGKNTQWAGRQLMVGFTLPLATLGTSAAKTFMDMEQATLKFKKVYGDLGTSKQETQDALSGIQELAKGFTKYGVAVSSTVALASDAAAAGFKGLDLQRQTAAASKLAVLGQIEQAQALETTIALQNAFRMSSEDLATSIDFLNAVENQTVTSLDDITTAIPKVAPVIQQLGGDVKDLAFFLTAMKEGGINASEGANALKSGLAALINPTAKASAMLKEMGIDVNSIVQKNQGDLKATVIGFAQALDTLAPLDRARAIEQMFGKFQFARLSTLFQNVTRDGTQASRVLQLAGSSVEDLASLSEQELGTTADSAMNKFRKAVEDLKVSLVPVGKAFLEAATPILKFVGNILNKFSDLSDGTKKAITIVTIAVGAIGPVALMAFGLLANGLANILKLFGTLRAGYLRLTGQSQILGEQTGYLTTEQLEAAAAAHSLDQSHAKLSQTFTAEASAVNQLVAAYQSATAAGARFASMNPGMMRTPKGFANGAQIVPGSGNGDTVPAMLTPGEAVLPKEMVQKYGSLISAMFSNNVPGYKKGNVTVGGRSLQLDISGQTDISSIQTIIDNLMNSVGKVANAEEIVVETIARVTDKVGLSLKEFKAQMDHVSQNISGNILPKSVIGERTHSAPTSLGGVKSQIEAERGASGLEEYRRAKAVASANLQAYTELAGNTTAEVSKIVNIMDSVNNQVNKLTAEQKAYIESSGVSVAKVAQLLQIDRAHIVEFTNAEKAYAEAWHSNVWVAQPHLENELSNTLKISEPTRKAYLQVLENQNISEEEKLAIQRKISENAALTEKELEIQARVLQEMLADTELMKKTSADFRAQATGVVAGQQARAGMLPIPGVGQRNAPSVQTQTDAVRMAINLGGTTYEPKAGGAKTINDFFDAMDASAETKSPSKRARRLGKNIVDGLVLGLGDGKSSASAAGRSVVDSTFSGLVDQYGRPLPSSGGGGTNIPSTNIATGGGSNEEMPEQKQTKMSMAKLNAAIMGSTFALTSLAGVGSMAGGAIGDMSQAVFKYSGLLFALMNITQLLTQAKIAELATTRIAAAKQAAAFASYGGGMASKAGLLGSIGRIGIFAKSLLGLTNPIGWIATGLTIAVVGFKLYNAGQERARQEVYGLAEAMKTTAKQAKVLGDFFGVVAKKSSLENRRELKNREIVGPKTRSQRDELRQDDGFQKEYKQTIANLRKATTDEAKLVFSSLALDLQSKGFAKDQVQTIIDALREESGKTDVKIDVKSMDFSQKSLDSMGKDLDTGIEKLKKQYANGFDKVQQYVVTGGSGRNSTYKLVEKLVPKKQLEKALAEVSTYISSTAESAATMFENGQISAEQYQAILKTTTSRISTLDAAQQKLVLTKLFKSLNIDAGPFLKNLTSAKQQMQVIALLTAGIIDKDSSIFKALSSNDAKTRGRGTAQLTKLWNQYFGAVEAATKAEEDNNKNKNTTLTKGQEVMKNLTDQITAIKNQIKTYQLLRKNGIDAKTAMDIAGDSMIAAAVASGAIKVGTKAWTEFINKVKELRNQTKNLDANMGAKSLDERKSAMDEQIKAFNSLVSSGMDYESALSAIEDAETVALINKPAAAGLSLQEVIDKLKATKAAADALANLDPFANMNKAVDQFTKGYDIAMEGFRIQEQETRDSFAGQISAAEKAVADAQANVDSINKTIDGINEKITNKQRDIEIQIDRPISLLQESIAKVEKQMYDAIDVPINKLTQEINNLQHNLEIGIDKDLNAISNRGTILSNNLALIERQEKSINDQFDAQSKALENINKLNQENIQQNKTKMSIADALSQGDISAAASAVQDLRAQEASAQAGAQQAALDEARKNALGQVSANGMTRLQIEQEQWTLSQKSFELEQQKLKIDQQIAAKQLEIYNLEQKRVTYQNQIAGFEKEIAGLEDQRKLALAQITAWEDQIWHLTNDTANSLKSANITLEEKKKKLDEVNTKLATALKAIDDQRLAWEKAKLEIDKAKNALDKSLNPSLATAQKAAEAALAAIMALQTTVTTTHIINTVYTTSGGGGGGGGGDTTTTTPTNPGNIDSVNKTVTDQTKSLTDAIKNGTTTSLTPSQIANNMATSLLADAKATAALGGTSGVLSSARYTGQAIQYAAQQAAAEKAAEDAAAKAASQMSAADVIAARRKEFGYLSNGGMVPKYFANGGRVGSDSVPAMLTPGEYVMNRGATQRFKPLLDSINNSLYPSMMGLGGGQAPSYNINARSYTPIRSNTNVSTHDDYSSTVYNYSVNVNVSGSDLDADDVASTVMSKIKSLESQRIRRQGI